MNKNHYSTLLKEAKLLFSSMHARKTRYLLINGGSPPEDWIFTNVKYHPSFDPKKHVDEYNTYKSRTDHVVHHVSFTNESVYKTIRDFIHGLSNEPLLFHLQQLTVGLNKIKPTKTESVNLFLHNGTIGLEVDGQKWDVGWVMGYRHIDDFYRTAIGAKAVLKSCENDLIALTLDELYLPKGSQFQTDKFKINGLEFHVPLVDGLHTVSVNEYIKKAEPKNPIFIIYMWPCGKEIYRCIMEYKDEALEVISHRPWVLFYPVKQ